jgi:hypothetical protein
LVQILSIANGSQIIIIILNFVMLLKWQSSISIFSQIWWYYSKYENIISNYCRQFFVIFLIQICTYVWTILLFNI